MARELTEQVEAGTWRRDDRAGVFRPRFTAAWVMTWQALPPFSMLRRWRIRRRASAILKDLNMDGPDPRPIAQPRTPVSLGWVAVVAIVVFLLTQFGSQVLRTAWTLPSYFVAPAAFADAVHALERLAGAKATPLVGTDSVGDSRVTEGFAVSVPSAWAERLVAMAQPRFLEKGFYLFRAEQHFGSGRRSDRVALFPRGDRYEILRLMGTNGWNYNVGPDSIIAWLRALERDHPFVLTGMGFDWVEGRFRSPIRDADALSRHRGAGNRNRGGALPGARGVATTLLLVGLDGGARSHRCGPCPHCRGIPRGVRRAAPHSGCVAATADRPDPGHVALDRRAERRARSRAGLGRARALAPAGAGIPGGQAFRGM